MAGLLIVNADDFGGNPLATDRIVECFVARRITSTSAMVHMKDSARAAQLAEENGLAVGLHLNLTQAFDDAETPAGVRERQARAVAYFAGGRRRRFTYNPRMSRLVRVCVADQLTHFRELFGREPTHIDGHNHVHLSPTALFSLPARTPVRTGESDIWGGVSLGAPMRRLRHGAVTHRYRTTRYFFAIDRLGQSPNEDDVKRLLSFADRASVEIMTHPDRNSDFALLMSDAWASGLERHALGSYQELSDE
ncbi:MAG: ChbG/HpnK family deacetylase [Solirubrobacteraceae bacterium]